MEKAAKKVKKVNLNWFTVSKIFWREQIVYYALTALSAFLNFLIDVNVLSLIKKIFVKDKGNEDSSLSFIFSLNSLSISFSQKKNFFIFLFFYISFYCLVVSLHIYIANYLVNKISIFIKKKMIKKIFSLNWDVFRKEKLLSNLDGDAKNFSTMIFFVPNQVFYLLLSAFLGFLRVHNKKNEPHFDVVLLGIFLFFLISLICCVLNFYVYKTDLIYQKENEKIKEKENFLVNNQKLIIKKNKKNEYIQEYDRTINEVKSFAEKRDWVYTLAISLPSYSLINYVNYIVLTGIFLLRKYEYESLGIFWRMFDQEKKMLDRLKDYPYYFSSKKRINFLMNSEERNDLQKNLIMRKAVESITLEDLTFSYKANKNIFQGLNLKFEKGDVNRLSGKNGFGKSTIINLIMWFYKPTSGRIIINKNTNLSDLNLIEWRKRIVYSENNNLIEDALSTGQKQLKEIDRSFSLEQEEEKQIFIFDEADNALDAENKERFNSKLKELSKKKLVILISH